MERHYGHYDVLVLKKLLGCANEFKEGDANQYGAALDDRTRHNARKLLANTSIRKLLNFPIYEGSFPWDWFNSSDEVTLFSSMYVENTILDRIKGLTVGELVYFLVTEPTGTFK